MPIDLDKLKQLRETRKALIDKTPLLFQAEVFNSWQWVKDYENQLISPNTLTDFKLALLKEAINIWDNKTYNFNNIKAVIKGTGGWESVIKGWLTFRTATKLDDDSANNYFKDRRGLPYIYDDLNEEINRLNQVEKDKKQAETDLKTWTDTFPDPADKNKPLTPEKVKIEYDKEKEKHKSDDFIISKSDYDNDWSLRVKKADYDTANDALNAWTNIFGKDKTAQQVSEQINKEKKELTEAKTKAEKERDALKTSVTDKEKIITQRDDYIKKQEAIITEKDATIAKLVQLVKETGDNDKLQALQVVASGNK